MSDPLEHQVEQEVVHPNTKRKTTDKKNESSKKKKKTLQKEDLQHENALREDSAEEDSGQDNSQLETASIISAYDFAPVHLPEPESLYQNEEVDDSLNFQLLLNNPKSMSEGIQIVGNILDQIPITIVDEPNFKGLKIECVDSNKSCLIQAKISANVIQCSPNHDEFVLTTKSLRSCLNSINPMSYVKISQSKDSNQVNFNSYDSNPSIEDISIVLNTVSAEPQNFTMVDSINKYQLDTSTDVIRSLLSSAKNLYAEDIEFIVYEPKAQLTQNPLSEATRHTIIRIRAKGALGEITKVIHTAVQHHKDENDSSSIIVNAIEANDEVDATFMSNLIETFKESYSCNYFTKFITSMTKTALHISIGVPMIIMCSLGDNNSYVRLAISPKEKEDQ